MSTTSKNKIMLITITLLLLTNIAMVFIFLTKDHGKRGSHGGREGMMTEFLKKEINFNAQQLQQFDSISKQYKEKSSASFDMMRGNKSAIFKALGSGAFSDSAIIVAANKSAEMQKEMEVRMLLHFKQIRKLCTAEQQIKFDSLFYKVWNRKNEGRNKSRQ